MWQCIVEQESIAYHNGRGILNEHDIKQNFNDLVKSEVMQKYTIYTSLGRNDYFVKIFAVKDFLITWENANYYYYYYHLLFIIGMMMFIMITIMIIISTIYWYYYDYLLFIPTIIFHVSRQYCFPWDSRCGNI